MNHARHRFETALRGWVDAWSESLGIASDPDRYVREFSDRFPSEYSDLIGQGLLAGWLVADGKYIRPVSNDERFDSGAEYLLSNRSREHPEVALLAEAPAHFAEYCRLRPLAERLGLHVLIEDLLMDITVRNDAGKLLAYIEVKGKEGTARALRRQLDKLGETACNLTYRPHRPDPEKKAMYLVKWRPTLLSIRAPGYRVDCKVTYDSSGNFRILDLNEPLEAALAATTPYESAHCRGPIDASVSRLAAHLRHEAPALSVEFGSGQTAWSFRLVDSDGKSLVLLGLYTGGELWSQHGVLNAADRERWLGHCQTAGFDLGPTKEWAFLRRDGERAVLTRADVEPLARQIGRFMNTDQ